MLCDELQFLTLSQDNYISNDNGTLWDLCFSTEYINITRCKDPLIPLDTHHPSVESLISNIIRYNFY